LELVLNGRGKEKRIIWTFVLSGPMMLILVLVLVLVLACPVLINVTEVDAPPPSFENPARRCLHERIKMSHLFY